MNQKTKLEPFLVSHVDRFYLIIFTILYFVVINFSLVNGYLDLYSDGFFYYAHLRTALVDRNFDFYEEVNYYQKYLTVPRPTSPNTTNGHIGNWTQVGWAVLCLPWFLLGRLITLVMYWSGIGVYFDGYDWAEIVASCIGSSVYGYLGVLLSYRLARYFFAPVISFWATLAIWSATSWVYYIFIQPSFSHSIVSFTVALLIFTSYHNLVISTPSRIRMLLIGAALGLACLVRLQEIIWGIVPFGLLVNNYLNCNLQEKYPFKNLIINILLIGLTTCAVFSLQMIEWKLIYDTWFLIPQGSGFFEFSTERIFLLLFSDWHGLIFWHPIISIALVGYISLFFQRQTRLFAGMLLCGFFFQVAVNSTATDWWAGESFGARRLLDGAVVWVLGLASILQTLSKRQYLTYAINGILVLLILLNLNLMIQFEMNLIQRESEPLSWSKVYHNSVTLAKTMKQTSIEKQITFSHGWGRLGRSFFSRGNESTIIIYQNQIADMKILFSLPPLGCPDIPGHINISLNDQFVTTIDSCQEQPTHELTISHNYWHLGNNILKFSYQNPFETLQKSRKIGTTNFFSPYDITTCSGGWIDPLAGVIKVNRMYLSSQRGGINIIFINPDGTIGTKYAGFEPNEVDQFAKFITTLPVGTIVALNVRDDSSLLFTGAGLEAIHTLGSKLSSLQPYQPYVLIGVKGANKGTAIEFIGSNTHQQTICAFTGQTEYINPNSSRYGIQYANFGEFQHAIRLDYFSVVPAIEDNFVLTTPDKNQGINILDAGDGLHETILLSDRSAYCTVQNNISPVQYLYFQVNDGFMFNDSQNIILTFNYFDNDTNPIDLQYDTAPAGYAADVNQMFKPVPPIIRTGTNNWKTATLTLDKATFSNNTGGADFRFAVGDRFCLSSIQVTKVETANTKAQAISMLPGQEPGIILVEQEDGLYELKNIDSNKSYCTLPSKYPPPRYLYFQVDQGFLATSATNVHVLVDYFDNSSNPINLEYDSTSIGLETDTAKSFKNASPESITRTNTSLWKTAEFTLNGATFNNHVNGADFRLVASDQICIGKVTVSK